MKTDMIKGNNDCALPLEVHFSHEHCQVLADMNSHLQPDYRQIFERYPYADGLRDISICLSAYPTDVEALAQGVREGKYSWIGIGWLIFITTFANAAKKMGMTPVQYADWIYDKCEEINKEAGFRAAWIEAYGEIGNSITWPEGKTYTKKEALEYFRQWLRDGRSLTQHWRSVSPSEAISYYSHAVSRNQNLRELPIYYSEGTIFSIHEAFRNGFPLVVYEGQCGTMNSIQTGIAFVRGGAKMYDAFWGCDFSPWTGGAQGGVAETDANGHWHEGMTPEYMFRTWITSYMSGCNTLLHEVGYCFFYTEPVEGLVIPSEYGHKAMQFYALKKGALSDRGKPVIPFAIMLEEEHGYRGDMVREFTDEGKVTTRCYDENPDKRLHIWQNRVPEVTRGDWQVHRLISAIWPLPDNKWKELACDWPDTGLTPHSEDVLTQMRLGEKDARDYDRFLSDSRWADCFDVITECTDIKVLTEYYKALFLAGDIKTDGGLWSRLKDFMSVGGIVVLSLEQLDDEASAFLNLYNMGAAGAIRVESILTQNGKELQINEILCVNEIRYTDNSGYVRARDKASGKPLVLEIAIGEGRLYVMLFSCGMDKDAKRMSQVYLSLVNNLYERFAGVTHTGPECQMIVNERAEDTLVTLLNHTGKDWCGGICVRTHERHEVDEIRDVVSDMVYPAGRIVHKADSVEVTAHVPAYSVKILSFGVKKENVKKIGFDTKTPFAKEDLENIQEMISKGPLEVLGRAPGTK